MGNPIVGRDECAAPFPTSQVKGLTSWLFQRSFRFLSRASVHVLP